MYTRVHMYDYNYTFNNELLLIKHYIIVIDLVEDN